MRVTIADLDMDGYPFEQQVADDEGVELVFLDSPTGPLRDPRVKGSDGLLVQYALVDAEAMDALLPELKVIGRYGVGVDNIDVDAATTRGIKVVNVPDYGAQSVADHTLALVMAVVRNLLVLDATARSGSANLEAAMPIHQNCNQRLGVLGFGTIGRAFAVKARGAGFETVVCDPMIPRSTNEVDGFTVVSMDELLATCDVISIHIPLLPTTHHLFNDETMARMKDGAHLINVSRGGVVDTDALVRALESGKLGGAGLDVMETEPLDPDHPITRLERVILTPHAAYYSAESYAALKRRIMQNTVDVLKGRPCANVMNPD